MVTHLSRTACAGWGSCARIAQVGSDVVGEQRVCKCRTRGMHVASRQGRKIARKRGARAMVVEDVMTEAPITVSSSTSIRKVIMTLFESDFRHLPIVDGGQLVGIVSDRDLRAFMTPSMIELEKPEEVQRRLAQPVSTVMNADVVSVTPETDLADVIEMMLDQKVGAIPVVRPDTQELVGIVSYVDVLRAAQELFED
ncbi:MAG: CBS domain-containing protein [Sorangiineae bacterium PRO1]|nr:CBS domain-containing protein [Sorangiineae bacterium PRO1]